MSSASKLKSSPRKKGHFVYVIECMDGRFYTGYTNNLQKRMLAHTEGKGAKFTRSFGFKKMLYNEAYHTKSRAMKREAEIKSLTRSEKEKLWNK